MPNPSNKRRKNAASSSWFATQTKIRPVPAAQMAFCAALSSHADLDYPVIFSFYQQSPNLQILQSRLKYAGGPFAALVSTPFREGVEKAVSLSSEDDPITFALIRDFLYCVDVELGAVEFPVLIRLLCAAHRWVLMDLFDAVSEHVVLRGGIKDSEAVTVAAAVIKLPEAPQSIRDYFWRQAARFFDGFRASARVSRVKQHESEEEKEELVVERGEGNGQTNEGEGIQAPLQLEDMYEESDELEEEEEEEEEDEEQISDSVLELDGFVEAVHFYLDWSNETVGKGGKRSGDGMGKAMIQLVTPLFPDIWELAISHDVLASYFIDVLKYSKQARQNLRAILLLLLMHNLEPFIHNDYIVCNLFDVLLGRAMRAERLLQNAEFGKGCSVRAMRLFSNALVSSRRPRREVMRFWKMKLGDGISVQEQHFSICGKSLSRASRADPGGSKHLKNIEFIAQLCMEDEDVEFKLMWHVEAKFPDDSVLTKFEVCLAVLDDEYLGECGERLEWPTTLYEKLASARVSNQPNELSIPIPNDILRQFRYQHGKKCICKPVVKVHVRLFDNY